VWSLIRDVVMPLVYSGVPVLKEIELPGRADATLALGDFIGYLLYAAVMVGLATMALRAVLAKPIGYVRERTRTCPACGMTVLEMASKCRFCGSPLPARRSHVPSPRSHGNGLTLSGTRTAPESDSRDSRDRRGRRGGRRRGGRGRPGPGPGPDSRRPDRDRGPSEPADAGPAPSST
jgi:hypothetical protein